MGVIVALDTYDLKLKDPKYAGVEITAEELSISDLWRFMELEKVANGRSDEAQAARLEVMQMLVGALLSWNVDDKQGNPVPLTVEGLTGRGRHFNAQLMDAWTDALVGISAPLPQTSTDGLPSVEASIPMETSSESLAS